MKSLKSKDANRENVAQLLGIGKNSDLCNEVCECIVTSVKGSFDGVATLCIDTGECEYDDKRLVGDYLKYALQYLVNEIVGQVKSCEAESSASVQNWVERN